MIIPNDNISSESRNEQWKRYKTMSKNTYDSNITRYNHIIPPASHNIIPRPNRLETQYQLGKSIFNCWFLLDVNELAREICPPAGNSFWHAEIETKWVRIDNIQCLQTPRFLIPSSYWTMHWSWYIKSTRKLCFANS